MAVEGPALPAKREALERLVLEQQAEIERLKAEVSRLGASYWEVIWKRALKPDPAEKRMALAVNELARAAASWRTGKPVPYDLLGHIKLAVLAVDGNHAELEAKLLAALKPPTRGKRKAASTLAKLIFSILVNRDAGKRRGRPRAAVSRYLAQ